MLRDFLAAIWRRMPRDIRFWSMRLTNTRFTVTACAIVLDQHNRVLLLKHAFRPGSGWGLPGGFMHEGEQPADALRRELNEEVGLQLEQIELVTVRTFNRPVQVEVVFRCKANGDASPKSAEVREIAWFTSDALPADLPPNQSTLIRRELMEQKP
jgi:ADP-ribose pyrophosphatase YjhB (NUDIX family)